MKELEIGYDTVTIELGEENVKTIINALKEVHKELEDWEFEIRLGVDAEKARMIEKFLKEVCLKMQTEKTHEI